MILWLHYTNGLEPPLIREYTGYASSTIQQILEKWQNEGTVKDLPRQGRPKELTSEVENMIIETSDAHSPQDLRKILRDGKTSRNSCEILIYIENFSASLAD